MSPRPSGVAPARVVWFPAGVAAVALAGMAVQAEPMGIVEFTPRDIIEWESHVFEARTAYRLVEHDGRPAVHAVCEGGAASGLYTNVDLDLDATPVMEWRWRVEETLSEVEETARQGDDYPARIYVVDHRTLLRWRTRAINYVWASEQDEGADWPNAHNSRAHMVAVRSGPSAEAGAWHTEQRNLRRDFERYHGRELDGITHLAVMTDCDDTGERLEGWYGTIRFLPDGAAREDRALTHAPTAFRE